MTLSTILGPRYEHPVNKIELISRMVNDEKVEYLLYATKNIIGLQRLPLDGNPWKHVAQLGHPKQVCKWLTYDMCLFEGCLSPFLRNTNFFRDDFFFFYINDTKDKFKNNHCFFIGQNSIKKCTGLMSMLQVTHSHRFLTCRIALYCIPNSLVAPYRTVDKWNPF